jgi:sec-independent protein translocase protein TatA
MYDTVILFPGIPGGPELLIVLLIAVLLFGANKIPKLARSTGEAMGEFKKGREEVEQELQDIREGPEAEGEAAEDEEFTDTNPTHDLDSDTGVESEVESEVESSGSKTTSE